MTANQTQTLSPKLPYFLGCPVWACPEWVGVLFNQRAKRQDWLTQYSTAFNTVEGNSTFYGLPSHETARRWCDETMPGFRFSLKFPRSITHEKQLMNANEETKVFFEILEILYAGDRLGPTFLQLPPSFAGNHFPVLATYLRDISLEFPLAVEVRHSDYFDHGQFENSLNDLLVRLQVDRVIFDSRALFSAPPSDEHEEEAQRRKPNSPLRQIVTGRHPLLRFVGRNDVEASMPWVQEWAPVVAEWIKAGLTPYVFTHTPHDFHAPQLARAFHQELSKWLVELPNLPSWLGERESENSPQTRQLELF